MDQPRQPNGHAAPAGQSSPDFFPLRLILHPGGALTELTRPDMVLGRHTGADVRLSLPDVSRRHCRCLFVDGNWHILDLNSMNGVWLNDTPVQQAVLRQGDVVRIGGFAFKVDLSARQLDPVTEVETDDSPRRAILKAPPPHRDGLERRRAS
jgi:pSer/pThr/pTyr-binding forkhead associated (FHA) protein